MVKRSRRGVDNRRVALADALTVVIESVVEARD